MFSVVNTIVYLQVKIILNSLKALRSKHKIFNFSQMVYTKASSTGHVISKTGIRNNNLFPYHKSSTC